MGVMSFISKLYVLWRAKRSFIVLPRVMQIAACPQFAWDEKSTAGCLYRLRICDSPHHRLSIVTYHSEISKIHEFNHFLKFVFAHRTPFFLNTPIVQGLHS